MKFAAAALLHAILCSTTYSAEPTTGPTTIRAVATYEVLDTQTIRGEKRSLDVRLSKPVTEDVLRAIALKLKDSDSAVYKRTFIAYYLPGMKVGSGAWATTHFDPKLKVEILGMTKAQIEAAAAAPAASNVIGRWIDNAPGAASQMTFLREGGKLFVEFKFGDGSEVKQELAIKGEPSNKQYERLGFTENGEYFAIVKDGSLGLRNPRGTYAVCQPVK